MAFSEDFVPGQVDRGHGLIMALALKHILRNIDQHRTRPSRTRRLGRYESRTDRKQGCDNRQKGKSVDREAPRCAQLHESDATDRRPKNEAQAKRRADQSHAPRAVLFRRHVRDVSLGRRNVAAGNAVDDSPDEQHPQRRGKTQNQKARARSEQTYQQNRPAAVLVGKPSQHGREDQLHCGIRSEQQSDLAGSGAEFCALGVVRQNRNYDPEAYEIDEDRNKDDEQW